MTGFIPDRVHEADVHDEAVERARIIHDGTADFDDDDFAFEAADVFVGFDKGGGFIDRILHFEHYLGPSVAAGASTALTKRGRSLRGKEENHRECGGGVRSECQMARDSAADQFCRSCDMTSRGCLRNRNDPPDSGFIFSIACRCRGHARAVGA